MEENKPNTYMVVIMMGAVGTSFKKESAKSINELRDEIVDCASKNILTIEDMDGVAYGFISKETPIFVTIMTEKEYNKRQSEQKYARMIHGRN